MKDVWFENDASDFLHLLPKLSKVDKDSRV